MSNMFASAWSRQRPTSVPVTPVLQKVSREESNQVMGKEVPSSWLQHVVQEPKGDEAFSKNYVLGVDTADGIDTTVIAEHKPDGTIEVQSITQEPAPVIETVEVNRLEVATKNLLDAMEIKVNGPIEVNLDQEEDDDWEKHGAVPVIVEEKFVDIDTHEVVSHTVTPHQSVNYLNVVDSVNNTLRDLGTATSEDAYTYGINHLYKMKNDRPDDWIVGHIFGGSYDLWISEYNEEQRYFYGFASFGGIDDDCAEWGTVSIDELLGIGPVKLERNFYWTPCTLESIKQKEYEQKEQAIQLSSDMSKPQDNMIETAMCFFYERNEEGTWYLAPSQEGINHSHSELEADDLHDIYFDTVELRDAFIASHPPLGPNSTWYPIHTRLLRIGKNVTTNFVDDKVYGVRRTSEKWKDGFTVDRMKEFVCDRFNKATNKSATGLKRDYGDSMSGGAIPLHKPGIGVSWSCNAKGLTIDMHGFQYVPNKEYTLTWKEVSTILTQPQESLPVDEQAVKAQRIADEVKENELPFSKEAELPPTYRKYEIAPRPTERKDRLIGNLVEEHGQNLTALYQNFSGKWGLHEVEFKDCENFHDYTALKQEFEMGQFFTPDDIAEKMVQLLRIPKGVKVADITCGMGRFFNFIKDEDRLVWFDNSYENLAVVKKLYPGMAFNTRHRDLSESPAWYLSGTVAYNIGNPPFNIVFRNMWHHPLATQADEEDGGKWLLLSQNAYVSHVDFYLLAGGVSFFIVPQTWLTGLRHKKVREFLQNNYYLIAELSLDDKAFSEYDIDFPTKAILMMKKGNSEVQEFELETYQGSFSDLATFMQSEQYQWFLKNKKPNDQHAARQKLKDMRAMLKADEEKKPYIDRVKKAIYETFRDKPFPKEEIVMGEVEDKKELKEQVRNLELYKTEIAMLECNVPSYKWEELLRKQYTRLEKALARTPKTELHIEVVITRYDILLRRSNTTVAEFFNKEENKVEINGKLIWVPNKYTKNELAVHDDKYIEFVQVIQALKSWEFPVVYKGDDRLITLKSQPGLMRHVEKLRRNYKLNSCDTSKLKEQFPIEYEENFEVLSELEFPSVDKEGNEKMIKLLPHQVEDLSGALLKRNALLSWDTGLGKTLGGITWSKMKGGKTLVIAPAVNTIDPWLQQLTMYCPDATVFLCKKKKDIFKYSGEDYLIVSFESFTIPDTITLPTGKRIRWAQPFFETQLMKYNFRNLILDESDNAKNKSSKRFKSLRKIAKSFKNRLLMSGTPTRNNVNEIYNQLEILCQNSNAMMCWAEQQVEYDRSSREWTYGRNPVYGSPFPAWGWYQAFERTFSPRKVTCFGAEETNQDIFNKDILDQLIRSIRFTRDMEEERSRMNEVLGITDFGISKEYKQVMVPMNETEEKVYGYILTYLAEELEKMYAAQHDGLTASMLTIAQQIMKLLQGTSHPWTFTGYFDEEDKWVPVYDLEKKTSSKLQKAMDIIDGVFAQEWENKVMIASPWRPTEEVMVELFKAKGYNVFHLRSEMSKHKRAELVMQFRKFPGNAIICGTMGVLKSGLNLPEVNTVIAESYPWNFAQLHQYAARAIRLNSTKKTDIYCLTSEGSFDVNVFSLILRKEVVNRFVRKSEEVTVAELSTQFGVESEDIFAQALQMVREKTNGKTRGTIRWGDKPNHEDSNQSTTVRISYEDKEKFVQLTHWLMADPTRLEIVNSLFTKSKEELLESLHNTNDPKFIDIISDTIKARFPNS